jgi:V/A-type H+/Na+-transporting ATPase subunit D
VNAVVKILHLPPGRAGRLWLQHRLSTAQHGADLLDHKLRLLRAEREHLALERDMRAAEWESANSEANTWLLRSVLLGGQRSVRLATSAPAEVRILWEQSMGVRYPAEATCAVPEPAPDAPPPGNAALVTARDRYRRAVQAAVRQAALETAVRVLEEQETATRHRLRAIEDRWIPRLQQALAELQFKLDEDEHNDAVRLRWAAGNRTRAERGSKIAASGETP